jgi:hypothetical protein
MCRPPYPNLALYRMDSVDFAPVSIITGQWVGPKTGLDSAVKGNSLIPTGNRTKFFFCPAGSPVNTLTLLFRPFRLIKFRNNLFLYGDVLLGLCPDTCVEDYNSSAVSGCVFNIFISCQISVACIRLYSIFCMTECASSSVTDVDCYVIISRKRIDLFSECSRHSYAGGKLKHTYTGISQKIELLIVSAMKNFSPT